MQKKAIEKDGQHWNEQRLPWSSLSSARAYPNSVVVALSAKSMTNGSGCDEDPTMSTARTTCTGQNRGWGPECCGRTLAGTAPRSLGS